MLLVDDVDTLRLALGGFFARHGFVVDGAAGRDEALALLARREYDVLITDLRFADAAEHGGLDVVRAARERSTRTRVVVLTAYGNLQVESTARAFGADLFLAKPQSLPLLAKQIRRLVDGEGEVP